MQNKSKSSASGGLELPLGIIVVPCYNEEEVIGETAGRLLQLLDKSVSLGKISAQSHILFVDDGSADTTWELVRQLHDGDSRCKGLKLSRNFGHQAALLSGLMHVQDKCDFAVSIDADLQDDVEAIHQFIDAYLEGYDIVYGVRNLRDTDTLAKKYLALGFYRLQALMGVKARYNHADFRLTSRRVLQTLASFEEKNLYLRAIFPLIGFKSKAVYYDRMSRFAGEPKYSFSKSLALAIDGITSFSELPLRLVTYMGLGFFLISIWMVLYIFHATLVRRKTIPGWASTVLPIYFIGGIQLLGIGVVGEYTGKIYREIKARPRFIVDSLLG